MLTSGAMTGLQSQVEAVEFVQKDSVSDRRFGW